MNNEIRLLQERLDTHKSETAINKNDFLSFLGDIDKNYVIDILSNLVSVIYINDKCIYGNGSLEVVLGEYKYRVSPTSFFQVNSKQTVKLYDKIKEYLGKDRGKVLDLYCGTGTIGIYVSDVCDEVVGIEINESSVIDANYNIGLNGLDNVSVIRGDVGKIIDSSKRYDAVIVDPPRSGLDNRTKKALLEIESKDIIYVSCDPVTLARDLKVLSSDYEIKDMVLVDMFPNTYHVESVVWMSQKKQ